MKQHLLPLCIASLIILTSMSDCEKQREFAVSVRAQFDGIQFSHDEITALLGNSRHEYFSETKDSCFFQDCYRTYAKDSSIFLCLKISCPKPLELNKKYYFDNEEKSKASASPRHDIVYRASEGFVCFTQPRAKSGIFEFTAVNKDDPDDIIKVTNGIFDYDY